LGRHKNPQTLDFIKRLKEKGESLGYKTAEEQPIMGGLYFADLVWQLSQGGGMRDSRGSLCTFI
jgi:hypothetical protein